MFSFHSYMPTVLSIFDVMECMNCLQKELAGSSLQNLQAFNWTYFIITRNVAMKMGTGYFRNDSLLEKIDTVFASYYFNALYNYVLAKTIAPSWQKMFDHCCRHDSFQFLHMALGVNAHVNNDLGLALFDTVQNPDLIVTDYWKVNQIIDDSISEVFHSLTEESVLVNKIKNRTTIVYATLLKWLIRNWRENAWNNFLQMRMQTTTEQYIEQQAEKIADNVSELSSLAKLYKVHAVFI